MSADDIIRTNHVILHFVNLVLGTRPPRVKSYSGRQYTQKTFEQHMTTPFLVQNIHNRACDRHATDKMKFDCHVFNPLFMHTTFV